MSDIERHSDEEPMPEEPTPSGVNDDEPMPSHGPPDNEELARSVPEEPTPSYVNNEQPMSSRALAPPPPPMLRHVPEPTPSGINDDEPMPSHVPPDNEELARSVPEEPTPSYVNDKQPMSSRALAPPPPPMLRHVPLPDNEALARRARTTLFLPDSHDSRRPSPVPSRVPPEIDTSRKRARSSSVEPPPSKRRKSRSVVRFFDLAAEDEDSGDDDEPRRVRRTNEDANDEEGEDDDEETLSDLEFIDDEPVHQSSHFTIHEETDAAALEALAASFKAAPASSPSAVSTSTSSLSSTSTSSHDPVLNLFQPSAPAPSDEPATVQRGEWIRLKQTPYEGKVAWVVSSQRFIVANLNGVGEADPCSRLTYDSPLRASAYPRVLPNPDELLPFKQTTESYLKQATFIGTAPALVEGVRVVVVAGEHKGNVGYIVMIREIADEKYRVRWAKIQEEYNGTDTVRGDSHGIFVQIAHLRRHALDPPTPFRVLDRVQVVAGIEHRGAIGRIIQIEDQWLSIQFPQESGEQNIIEVEHRCVARHFMEGDFVCVTGASRNRRGLVVKICTGGALELYSGQRNFNGSDIDEDPLWRVPSRDVNFDLNSDSSMSSWAALMPQLDIIDLQTFSAQKSSRSALTADAQFIDLSGALGSARQLLEGKAVGRRYEGMEVLVAWQGPLKGTRGVVVGDFDSPDRAARIQKCKRKYQVEDDDGIMVTVQKEASNARFTLNIKKLVHVHTRMPLSKTKALPRWMLAPQSALTRTPARVGTPLPPSRSPTPAPQVSWTSNSQVLDGELDGRWLCLSALVQKRVDVVLKDIVRSENRYFRPGKRILSCEGRAGYLALDQPFREEDLDKKMIRVWAVGPNGTNHPVRGPCIRPMRQMADGTPINRVVTRVVIIGPDTGGDVGKLGCYGEARPHNDQVSAVKFQNSGLGFFHLNSLCRSLNVPVPNDGGVLGTTVFN
ncbi:hypothetical protein C8R44DRAFT_754378 [Mycena epipterygia]|nr:hypothetical protein C8R44DRAFT_754378 [Mycena epipterygia]